MKELDALGDSMSIFDSASGMHRSLQPGKSGIFTHWKSSFTVDSGISWLMSFTKPCALKESINCFPISLRFQSGPPTKLAKSTVGKDMCDAVQADLNSIFMRQYSSDKVSSYFILSQRSDIDRLLPTILKR